MEIPSVPDRDRRLLLVLDGLYVAGAQRHCLSALEALGNYGFECTVLALEGGGQWADRFVKAARRVVIPSPTSISWENIGSLLGAANFELVIAHLVAPILWSNDHIPKALRCYAHLHSEPSEHEEVSAEMLKSVLGRFERFFVPSQATLDSYLYQLSCPNDSGPTSQKFRVLPNGVFSNYLECVAGSNSKVRNRYNSTNIAVISRLDSDKLAIPLFVETIVRLKHEKPHLKVLVAGDGESRAEMQRAVNHAGLGSVIRFLGFIDDIAWVYKWADVIFLPSKRESMPYVLLESLEMSRPLVAPACGLLQKRRLSRSILPYPPNNATAASRAILKAISPAHRLKSAPDRKKKSAFLKGEAWSSTLIKAYDLT